MEDKKCPLEELFLNEEQTKYFNLGKKQGEINSKKKVLISVDKEIKKIRKEFTVLKAELTRVRKDRDYYKKKVGWVENREEILERKILKLKDKFAKAQNKKEIEK